MGETSAGLKQTASGIAKLAAHTTKKVGKVSKNHPTIPVGAAAYTAGAYGAHKATLAHQNPEFYDSTPNKGRADDKHPYGGGY